MAFMRPKITEIIVIVLFLRTYIQYIEIATCMFLYMCVYAYLYNKILTAFYYFITF